MDTTYHSYIPIETLSLLDCDVKNFNFIHPIKNIFFDNIDYIRKLDASGKARPCILDNVERSLLCHTCYLGFDQFECTDCDNWNIIPHSCHIQKNRIATMFFCLIFLYLLLKKYLYYM